MRRIGLWTETNLQLKGILISLLTSVMTDPLVVEVAELGVEEESDEADEEGVEAVV